MQTKSKEKINIVTLGCAKNIVDSEVLLTQLKGNNKDAYHQSEDISPDVVIVNTCGLIDNAKQQSVDTILSYAKEKESGNIKKLYVTGCLSERYKQSLEEDIPEVDGFYGTRDLPDLLKNFQAQYRNELIGERVITTDSHYAFLKISEGCDRPCSFCAIPLMRGKHKSKPIQELVKEASILAKDGVKELILIAQDLTYYGLDLYKKRELSSLLRELVKVEGIEWIRLHYAFPNGFPLDVLDVIKNEKNIYFLEKKFTFKNFVESQKFVNEVGRISEEEGHHPEILFGWGYAKINISTHAIEGLSENDFILASKIDKI